MWSTDVILRPECDPKSNTCGVQGDDKELLEACQTRLAVTLVNIMGCCHDRVRPSSVSTSKTQLVAFVLSSLYTWPTSRTRWSSGNYFVAVITNVLGFYGGNGQLQCQRSG